MALKKRHASTGPVCLGSSGKGCPMCGHGQMMFWRRESSEWLACDQCGRQTRSVMVCEGPYRYELLALLDRMGSFGIKQGGA